MQMKTNIVKDEELILQLSLTRKKIIKRSNSLLVYWRVFMDCKINEYYSIIHFFHSIKPQELYKSYSGLELWELSPLFCLPTVSPKSNMIRPNLRACLKEPSKMLLISCLYLKPSSSSFVDPQTISLPRFSTNMKPKSLTQNHVNPLITSHWI